MMKITTTFCFFSFLLLSACSSPQSVPVVKAPLSSQVVSQHFSYRNNMPIMQFDDLKTQTGNNHIKAICRDGSYVIEINESSCLGHGGIAISSEKYRAD